MKPLRPERAHIPRARSWALAIGCLAGLLAPTPGCGGSPGNLASGGDFILESVSVTSGQTWQLNRPIEFVFSQPIDFGTVSMNTVNIAEATGGPAIGEFRLDPTRPRVVVFQPRCPLAPDLSDAGLLPGGRQYRVDVPTEDVGATTVRSAAGAALEVGASITFFTPVSILPGELFLDTRPGPVQPLPGRIDADGVVRGTRLEFLTEDELRPPIPFVLIDGVGALPDPEAESGEFVVPLNLYSEPGSRFRIVVELDQPVSPALENIDPSRVQLRFRNGGSWEPFGTAVKLVGNCTEGGAVLELTPRGVLPQNREMRVVIEPAFEDLVGTRGILPLDQFATMSTRAFRDPSGTPLEHADEVLDGFLLAGGEAGSIEDTDAIFLDPRADWSGGRLTAAFAFEGTGGPGGDFDWHIPPNQEFVLDTVSTTIIGGPGGVQSTTHTAIGGVVDIRDLFIPASSSIRVQGPNPAVFLCSGNVVIQGAIRVNGGNAQPIMTVNNPTLPQAGASGTAGGGDGGIGSWVTNAVTTRGGAGHGAFDLPFAGGEGGESGWGPSEENQAAMRRCAGGGGGTFGPDVVFENGCADQMTLGLDAESGFPGAPEANAAERPGELMPWGGREATRPFNDVNGVEDDFLGILRKDFGTDDERLVQGELLSAWAGSGGGGGGDSTQTETYPPPTLVPTHTDKGAGGGGGAGALTIYALGDIVLGATGRIEARGGHGSGGENTTSSPRVGGGSGGGAGGHVLLHSASQVDLSAVPVGTVAINARGGQGGAGANNSGGADNEETTIAGDAKHVGTTGPNDTGDNPWIPAVPMECQFGQGVIRAAGGDGGPGIVQIHVGLLPDDVLYPGDPANELTLAGSVKPAPVGYDRDMNRWVDQLVPAFGRFSTAQSRWIPLGELSLPPDAPTPEPFAFLFGGTDPETGLVERSGAAVMDLEPLLAPEAPVEADGLPDLDPLDPRTVWLDAAALDEEDAIYRRNPQLLRRFRLRMAGLDFDIAAAVYDEAEDRLGFTVDAAGPALPTEGTVAVLPRFFAIGALGVDGYFPESSAVRIQFQATVANSAGDPDESSIVPGDASPQTAGWSYDLEELNTPENATFRFFRFRVTFDIQADGGELSGSAPRPYLDFLRVPFRF